MPVNQKDKDKGFFEELFGHNNIEINSAEEEKFDDVLMISKDDFINFCRVLIDFIKETIEVSHDFFDKYIDYIKAKNINIDIIICDMLSENRIKYLLQKANIIETKKSFLQATRCTQVITLALLKCIDYDCLKISLTNLTNLSRSQIYVTIYKYITILGEFNSNLNVKRWLPEEQNPPITYDDCIKVAEGSDKGIIFDMTTEEFNEVMKNRSNTNPSQVYLKWKCKEEGHEWWTDYNSIRRGTGCHYCFGSNPITYDDCIKVAEKSDKGIIFNMTTEEFEEVMKNRGNIKPSQVDLIWRCKKKINHYWYASYNNIQKGTGCPNCGERMFVIGVLAHYILEYLSIKYFKSINCLIKYETYINENTKFYPDLIIERDENFKNNLELNFESK